MTSFHKCTAHFLQGFFFEYWSFHRPYADADFCQGGFQRGFGFWSGRRWSLCRNDSLWNPFPRSLRGMCPHRSSFGGPLASQRDDCRFFVGIGLSAVLAGFTNNPLQMAFGLAAIGVFAAIYHPVGIAMVIEGEGNVGWRLGLNGVWGNMGVAGAPLVTGFILAEYDWRLAFIIPGSFRP